MHTLRTPLLAALAVALAMFVAPAGAQNLGGPSWAQTQGAPMVPGAVSCGPMIPGANACGPMVPSSPSSPSAPAWVAASYQLPNGQMPSFVMDFVNNQYFDGVTSATLSSLVGGSPSVSASGLHLNSATLTAIGAALTAMKQPAQTIVAVTNGGSAGTTAGIVSFGADAPLFKVNSNVLRSFIGSTSLDTLNLAVWTAQNWMATSLNGSGRQICQNLGNVVSDAKVATTTSAVQLGSYAGASLFGGFMQVLVGYPSSVSPAYLKALCGAPPPYLFAFSNNTSGIKFRSNEFLTAGNVLQYSNIQPWTMETIIKIPAAAISAPAVVFGNTAGSTGPYQGYETFIDNATSCSAHVRIMAAYSPGFNLIDVNGSKNMCGSIHAIATSYDGSGLASGVKIYEDGVLDPSVTVVTDGLSSTSANANPFYIGNQNGFTNSFFLNGGMGWLVMSNIARSGSYIAANANALPAVDANTVLSYAMTEQTGTSVGDGSSSGTTGALSSATQWLQ